MSDATSPQPGWYADPENPAGERWWNGSGWSEHKRDSTEAAAAATAVPAPVSTPVPDSAGFTFGAPTLGTNDARPDPYAPPPAAVAQPYYASPYVAAPYGAPAYGSGINGLALAGVIASGVGWLILPVIGSVAGIILSAFGLSMAKRREAAGNPNTGRGLAIAGLIVGIVIGSITLVFYIVLFAFAFSPTTYY
jgi:hypothetical protein